METRLPTSPHQQWMEVTSMTPVATVRQKFVFSYGKGREAGSTDATGSIVQPIKSKNKKGFSLWNWRVVCRTWCLSPGLVPLPDHYFRRRWDKLARKGTERQICAKLIAGTGWQWKLLRLFRKLLSKRLMNCAPCTRLPDLAENLSTYMNPSHGAVSSGQC